MNHKYLLQRLFQLTDLVRKAQRTYYSQKGDPKTDLLKKQYLADSKRKEADLDALMANLPRLCPSVVTDEQAAGLPAGAKQIAEVNDERLAGWSSLLNKNTAVARIVVAVGGGDNLGKLVVLWGNDVSKEDVLVFLNGAIQQVGAQ